MTMEKEKKKLTLDLNTEGLGPAQIRLIRSMNSLLVHILKTNKETEFFDGGADLMRNCASLIKQSSFVNQAQKNCKTIPYGEQALEYSIDVLQECIERERVIQYDN